MKHTVVTYIVTSLFQCVLHPVAPLLTNYRCHDTILRLPSVLFFESTLQARSTSQLHPSCISALEFVCSSFDQSKLCNCPDYDDNERDILLEQVLCIQPYALVLHALNLQVEQYIKNWPVAEWGPVSETSKQETYAQICIMSPSATQVSLAYIIILTILRIGMYIHAKELFC